MELLAIVIPVIVVLAGLVVFAASRRSETARAQGQLSRETRGRDRGTSAAKAGAAVAEAPLAAVSGREVEKAAALARRDPGELATVGSGAPVPWTPPDDEAIGVARRQFLNRSIIGLMGVSISGFGAGVVAFLYGGSGGGGFGSKIDLGLVPDIEASIDGANGFFYVPEGRAWVTRYPEAAVGKAEAVYSSLELAGMRAGLVALYQKCPHLGCRVPQCLTSQWFECPCHGSQYNRVGEKRGGPAPRGMDRFAMEISSDNHFIVDTGTIIQGPPIGTNTTGQEAEGPSCIGDSSH